MVWLGLDTKTTKTSQGYGKDHVLVYLDLSSQTHLENIPTSCQKKTKNNNKQTAFADTKISGNILTLHQKYPVLLLPKC